MSIAEDLDKLISLRDRGDLSLAEFRIAKERLLSGDLRDASMVGKKKQPLHPEERKPKLTLVIAVLSTIAAAFSAGSAVLGPTPLSLLAFVLFSFASALNWIQVSKSNLRS